MDHEKADAGRLALYRGLLPALRRAVIGQDQALEVLSDAILAGEMGHTPAGRPRSIVLVLGPTGTGKTQSIEAASRHLFGTGLVARVNCAEFSSEERVPLLLGLGEGSRGILGDLLARVRSAGGRILLLDEVEKAHPRVADHLLGLEEASLTLATGERLDLSDMHVVATSNVGSQGVGELGPAAAASVRRYVEQEAALQFRPEVFARFTAVAVFAPLGHEAQMAICSKMVGDEMAVQSLALSTALGHAHQVSAGPGIVARLASEGWHRRLGARPMRNVVERRIRAAVVKARLDGTLQPGVARTRLVPGAGMGLRAAVSRDPVLI